MSERKPLQLTIKLPRPIITGSSVGSEEVSGTTSSTTPRCTGRIRHPRLRAPFSPQTVRTTEISGQESHSNRLLGFIKKIWKCESGKGSACILSYSNKLISQIVEIGPSPDPRLARLRLPSSTRHRPQHCQRATTSSRDITSDSTTKRASRAHPLPARPPPSPPRPPPQVPLAQTHWLFSRWNRRQPRRRQRRKLPPSDRLTISNITPL